MNERVSLHDHAEMTTGNFIKKPEWIVAVIEGSITRYHSFFRLLYKNRINGSLQYMISLIKLLFIKTVIKTFF